MIVPTSSVLCDPTPITSTSFRDGSGNYTNFNIDQCPYNENNDSDACRIEISKINDDPPSGI